MTALPDLTSLNAAIAAGRTSCAALVETALARATDPAGEGCRVFRAPNAGAARRAAAGADRLRAIGAAPSPLAGLPVSLKDNIDVAGEITVAGSPLLEDAQPARSDAVVVARLKAAGAALVGRTNMSELAFSGIGFNRFFGTPANPWDRAGRRIPGGSSSGAAVSVADGMAVVAIGTDTGGSAAFPRRSAVLPDSSRPGRVSRATAFCRCRACSIAWARWRATWPIARLSTAF